MGQMAHTAGPAPGPYNGALPTASPHPHAHPHPPPSPASRRGALFGLTAAALFGASAPLAKRLVPEVGPFVLAALLYLGAGLALSVVLLRRAPDAAHETPLRRQDAAPLAGIVALGGMLGPVLMLMGLARLSAVAGSLLLNLEAPFTILLAVLLFGEHLGGHAPGWRRSSWWRARCCSASSRAASAPIRWACWPSPGRARPGAWTTT